MWKKKSGEVVGEGKVVKKERATVKRGKEMTGGATRKEEESVNRNRILSLLNLVSFGSILITYLIL